MAELVELTEMGVNKSESNVLNLNKSRMRAIYRRPVTTDKDGNKIGGELTSPLPADPQSQIRYFGKGFTAPETKNVKPRTEDGIVPCPLCEFGAKSTFGLISHLRTHTSKSNKEESE